MKIAAQRMEFTPPARVINALVYTRTTTIIKMLHL